MSNEYNYEITVSIICNAYNHEEYIRKTLEGFVMQKTDFIFEVLVHDDASSDHTAEIIREFEVKYPNIIKPIYETENQYSKHDGSLSRIQYERVKGKYVAFCEGDDYWIDENKLQRQVNFMDNHPDYSLCVTSSIMMDVNTKKEDDRMIISQDRDIDVTEIIKEEHGRFFQLASSLFRKDIVLNIPMWRISFPVGDTALFIQAGINGKIRMLADITSVYNCGTNSSWTKNVLNTIEKRVTFLEKLYVAFESFNIETNKKYNDAVRYRLDIIRANIDEAVGNYENIVSNRTAWNKFSLRQKISVLVKWKFPLCSKLYMQKRQCRKNKNG